MALKKPSSDVPAAVPANGMDGFVGDSLQLQLPLVVEHLICPVWADGSARQTSTLMLLWEEGRWKACLHDRAADRSGWVSGRTLMDVLVALEAGLLEEDIDWRKRRPTKR